VEIFTSQKPKVSCFEQQKRREWESTKTDQKRLIVVIVEEEGEVPTSHKFCQGDFCQEEEGGHVPSSYSFICGEQREPGNQKTHKKKKTTGIIIIFFIIIFFFFFKLQKSNTTTIFFSLLLLLQAPEIKYNHHLLLSSSSSSSFLSCSFRKTQNPTNTLQPIIIHHLSLQAHLIIFFFGNSKVCLHFFFSFFKKSH
jgi:hypothetical protein